MGQSWTDRLRRRLGFLAIPGLAGFLTGMNAAVGLLSMIRPDFPSQLVLDPGLVRAGQLWRPVTYLFVPPATGPLWLLLWLILFYSYTQKLESAWGDFKFTLFCALGAAGTALAGLVLDVGLSNSAFHMSLFLAFARLYPDFEILLFFVLPVKMKWLAAAAWLMTAASFLFGDAALKLSIAAGLVNYFLFFGAEHWQELKLLRHRWRNRGRF